MPLPLNTPGADNGFTLVFAVNDPYRLLTHADLDWLLEVDYFDYPLIKYANLAALHREVTVEISPDTPKYPDEKVEMTVAEVEQAIEQLEAELWDLEDHSENHPDFERESGAINSLLAIYRDALRRAQQERKGPNDRVTIVFKGGLLLGKYIRSNPGDRPKVVLYVNNMNCRESLLSTYVHEMMHAYYDTDKSLTSDEHYIPCLEEPLAELGMLRFMQVFNEKYNGIYSHALWKVKQKKYVPSMCFYGFGAYMNEVLNDKVLPELLYRASKPIASPVLLEYTNVWRMHKLNDEFLPELLYRASKPIASPEWLEYTNVLRMHKYPFHQEAKVVKMMYKVFGYNVNIASVSAPLYIIPPSDLRWYNDEDCQCAWAFDGVKHSLYLRQSDPSLPNITIEEFGVRYGGRLLKCYICSSFNPIDYKLQYFLHSLHHKNIYFNVDRRNSMYTSKDGALLLKHPYILLYVPWSRTHFTIPHSVTSIGDCTFSGCSGLTSIKIPNSVTSIGYRAFGGCSGLTSITIPNSVTSIGNGAFSGCRGLTSISVDLQNPTYDSRNNCNAIIETATNTLIAGCIKTSIPNGVTLIGDSAFCCCSGLTSIVIPNGVISIGMNAFEDCSGLPSINIPNSVTSIGDSAFNDCRGLKEISIPDSVKSIGKMAFAGCSKIKTITIPNSVTTIRDSAFEGCNNLKTIYVPKGEKSRFAAMEGLQGLEDKIVEK